MEIIRTDTPEIDAGKALSLLLNKYLSTPILLLVSGGSAFSVLEHCDTAFLGKHVTLVVLDERYSIDLQVNNYGQLASTNFFKTAVKKGVETIDSSVHKNESSEALSKRLEQSICEWTQKHPDGKIIATMGIGEDGHTAGILPNVSTVDFNGEKLVVSYKVSAEINQYTDRITTTFTFLRKYVDEAIVYAVGEKKKRVIISLSGGININEIPAEILKEMKSVKLFTNKT